MSLTGLGLRLIMRDSTRRLTFLGRTVVAPDRARTYCLDLDLKDQSLKQLAQDLGWKLAHKIAKMGNSKIRSGMLLPGGAEYLADKLARLGDLLPAGAAAQCNCFGKALPLDQAHFSANFRHLKRELDSKSLETAVGTYADAVIAVAGKLSELNGSKVFHFSLQLESGLLAIAPA